MAEATFSSAQVYDGFLRINSCGKRDLQGSDYDTCRPDGRVDYSIQYIRKGRGYAETDGGWEPVEEGSLILYFPGTRQHYLFREQEPAQLLWAHFSGTVCQILEPFRQNRAVLVKVRDRKEFERNFDKLITARYRRDPGSEELGQAYLYVMLGLLRSSGTGVGELGKHSVHEGLDKVLSHMQLHYNEPIDLDFYAGMCFVSKNRFIHLFRDYTGLPPYRYQLKMRMDWARETLENTAISVKECARMVGFSDVSYFCRLFKKFNGHSPSYFKTG